MARPRRVNIPASQVNEIEQIKLVLDNTPSTLLNGVVDSIVESLQDRQMGITAALDYVRRFSHGVVNTPSLAIMPKRGPGRPPRNTTTATAVAKSTSSGKRELSPSARAAIIAGQAKRWAKVKKEKAAIARAAKAKAATKAANRKKPAVKANKEVAAAS